MKTRMSLALMRATPQIREHPTSYIHPAAVEHHRKRWERADAYRFAAPGTPEAKMPGSLRPWAAVARAEEAKAAADAKAHAEFVAEVEALRAANERVRIMLADVKFELALRRIFHKYSPDQPRVPAGHPDGGQWTSGGGSGAGRESDQPTAAADVTDFSAARRGAGGIPQALWNLTVRQFVSRYCAGQVNRELPRQFEDITIADLLELRKGGDAAADKCYKLLNQPRFRK